MNLGCRTIVVALALVPTVGIAQRPIAVLGGGVHAQSVGGATAGGISIEVGAMLYVAPILVFRPELALLLAPSQGAPSVFAATRLRGGGGGAGGHPSLLLFGGSLLIARTSVDSARWYAFAGAAIAHGSGNDSWSATRPAFVPHLGIGLRPFPSRPRLVLEARGRYAPIWYNDPVQIVSVIAGWSL